MLPSVCTANKILEYKERYIHTAGCTHPVLNPLARYTRTCSDDYHLCPVNLHSKLCVEKVVYFQMVRITHWGGMFYGAFKVSLLVPVK